MKVYVNNREVNLMPGMTVKHAIIAAEMEGEVKKGKKAYDEMGNEIGLGGALSEGMKIFLRLFLLFLFLLTSPAT